MSPIELKNIRKSMGLTQAGLAELIGVTRNTVARWELGIHPISFPIERLLKIETPSEADTVGWNDMDLSRVLAHARQAFEQERFQKCLNLTKILLQADPENEEARALESSIRTAIQQDLEHARALVDHAQLQDKPQVFGRGAEIILGRVLSIDPDNQEAKALMSVLETRLPDVVVPPAATADPLEEQPQPSTPTSVPDVEPEPVLTQSSQPEPVLTQSFQPEPVLTQSFQPEPVLTQSSQPEPVLTQSSQPEPVLTQSSQEDSSHEQWLRERITGHPEPTFEYEREPFFAERPSHPLPSFSDDAAPTLAPPTPRFFAMSEKRMPLMIPIVLAAVLAILAVVMWQRQPSGSTEQESMTAALSAATLQNGGSTNAPIQPTTPQPTQILPATSTDTGESPIVPTRPLSAASSPAASANSQVAAPKTGSLALNSALTADIYVDGKYLGSTPTTLELPAGNVTLEYRHEDLRKVVTHVIRPNETIATKIAFEVSVQVNARPWAQVILEGNERQVLGQTPLSGVVIPAGSTLVFENPNFPRKNYRVTGKETAIQVVFP